MDDGDETEVEGASQDPDRDTPAGASSEPGSQASSERASREELAEDRTDWAMERTLLAKQRTFAAWLRTGTASVAVGFAAARLLGDVRPEWVVQVASALLILSGAAILIIGYLGYQATFRKLEREGFRGLSPRVIAAVTAAMFLAAALLMFAIVWGS